MNRGAGASRMTKTLCLALMASALVACNDRPPVSTAGSAASKEIAGNGDATCASHEPISLEGANVPRQFNDLIPLARQWGISDDSARSNCIAESTASDRQSLATALAGRTADIHRWLDEKKPGQARTNEQSAFLYMLNSLEIMDAMQSTPGQAR